MIGKKVHSQWPRVDHKHSDRSRAHEKFKAPPHVDFHQPYVLEGAIVVDCSIRMRMEKCHADHESRVIHCFIPSQPLFTANVM